MEKLYLFICCILILNSCSTMNVQKIDSDGCLQPLPSVFETTDIQGVFDSSEIDNIKLEKLIFNNIKNPKIILII